MQDDRKVCEEGLEMQENEGWECVVMEAAESLSKCLEQVSNPRRVRGSRGRQREYSGDGERAGP